MSTGRAKRKQYRSSVTGAFVTKAEADANPRETTAEDAPTWPPVDNDQPATPESIHVED